MVRCQVLLVWFLLLQPAIRPVLCFTVVTGPSRPPKLAVAAGSEATDCVARRLDVDGRVPFSRRCSSSAVCNVAKRQKQSFVSSRRQSLNLSSKDDGENDDDSSNSVNPYADPNYPDLEFVNYDDPEYATDGLGEADDYSADSTEEEIEAMREERRRRNDEYQFQTYWTSIWGAGDVEYKGEWTVYYSNTFYPEMDDSNGEEGSDNTATIQVSDENDDDDSLPRLIQASEAPLSVISRAQKQILPLQESFVHPVEAERIVHTERLEQIMGDADLAAAGTDAIEQVVLQQTYWPNQLAAVDFRGPPGIMVCGNAWTICTAVPLVPAGGATKDDDDDDSLLLGPFREYRVELGICAEDVRLRVKFDYSIVGSVVPTQTPPPPLELKTMTVCREAANVWPRSSALASSFFDAPPGAAGGLYDPPPINEQYASQYCMVDMEGGATALFPVRIDQNVEDSETEIGENGNRAVNWITSLDWTAGAMRYQVDRKSHGGVNIRGLKTLELSEVQSADADQYRPRDGGQDMRQ